MGGVVVLDYTISGYSKIARINKLKCINNTTALSGKILLNNAVKVITEIMNSVFKTQTFTINLIDASRKFMCNNTYINLPVYHILKYGESWYNTFGFKSYNYDTEVAHNRTIRTHTFGEYRNNYWKLYKKYCDATEYDEDTLEEVADSLYYEYLCWDDQRENLTMIADIFDYLYNSTIISYNPDLYMQIG